MTPFVVADRRHRERNRQAGAILALTDGLVVVDLLAAPDLREDDIFFGLELVGDQHADGLADRFGSRVAKHPLCGWIP